MKIFIIICLVPILAFIIVVLVQAFVVFQVKYPPFKNPPHEPQVFGEGELLNYVVMGDSTAAGRGAEYNKGIAVRTAQELAKKRQVSLVNIAISGATVGDVLRVQVPEVAKLKPDLVLISLGSNDVTHLTPNPAIRKDLNEIIDLLLKSNCNMKIVLTGAAEVGAVPLFPQPLRYVAGIRTKQVNNVFRSVATIRDLELSEIARETGPLFKHDKTLFASDKFHPNERGYAVWNKVLNKSLIEALENQPSHCKRPFS